jgi:tetratricopeptide (TPR) repeat protein
MCANPRQQIDDKIPPMFRSKWIKVVFLVFILSFTAIAVYQIQAVNRRLSWRVDIALTYLRGVFQPAVAVPTPKSGGVASAAKTVVFTSLPPSPSATPSPTQADILATLPATSTSTPTPTAIPERVDLPAPGWEQQDWNNCGPAALSMYLNYYGWEGDQYDIAAVLKPQRNDRNVNVEELDYFTRNYAGWLTTLYRVGGDVDILKKFIAADIPVLIEASFFFDGAYWPNDDLWAAHYLLITGYDEADQSFMVQDTFHGPNQILDYETLNAYWEPFNRVFVLIYLPDQEETVKSILGLGWDEAVNRQQALEAAQEEIDADPQDAFAWFNLGTNLLYFERYEEAAAAYDQARTIGWPQRMLRYQFGPFFAYFHSIRTEDLLTLTEYALQRTPNSEEALLWHGWGLYRMGDINGAVADFQAALEANYTYLDAQYALDFVLNP